jgi:hypothetical protein
MSQGLWRHNLITRVFSRIYSSSFPLIPPSSISLKVNHIYVGFEVLTAVIMMSSIFWDITLCSPLKANERFGGTYRFKLHGRKINQARNHYEAISNFYTV